MKTDHFRLHKNLLYVSLVILFIGVLFILYTVLKSNSFNSSMAISTQRRTEKWFHSDNLKISFKAASNFSYKDNVIDIILTNNSNKIIIERIDPNTQNLENYLNKLSSLNHVKIISREDLVINQHSAVKGKILHLDGSKDSAYFIYTDGWVYTLETSSQELFSDLDRIAQTFEYTP